MDLPARQQPSALQRKGAIAGNVGSGRRADCRRPQCGSPCRARRRARGGRRAGAPRGAQRRRAAQRPVLAPPARQPRDGAALLGEASDRHRARLRPADLHARQLPRPSRRSATAGPSDRRRLLSGAGRSRPRQRPRRRQLAQLVCLFPLGGLAPRQAGVPDGGDRAPPPGLGAATPTHCEASAPRDRLDRRQRLRIAFGCDGAAWDEEKALERYELLCEAGLLGEAAATPAMERPPRGGCRGCGTPCSAITPGCWPAPSARCGAASNASR